MDIAADGGQLGLEAGEKIVRRAAHLLRVSPSAGSYLR
jgi:hypothetical protein